MAHPTERREGAMRQIQEDGDGDGRVRAATEKAIRDEEASVELRKAEIKTLEEEMAKEKTRTKNGHKWRSQQMADREKTIKDGQRSEDDT